MSAIPARYKRLAEAAVRDAARELGITPPAIVWWRETKDASWPMRPVAYGWVTHYAEQYAATINLVDSMPPEEVRGVTFHEVRHVWQNVTGCYLGDTVRAEDDAEAWAYQKTGYLGWPYYSR